MTQQPQLTYCESCIQMTNHLNNECCKHNEQPQSWEERWEDKFEQGFSFEGDNDPNSTPKMMFVRLHDGTKTIARPEYFKEFFKAFIAKEKEESERKVLEGLIKEIDKLWIFSTTEFIGSMYSDEKMRGQNVEKCSWIKKEDALVAVKEYAKSLGIELKD